METEIEENDLSGKTEEEADILRRSKKKNNNVGEDQSFPSGVRETNGEPVRGRKMGSYRDSVVGERSSVGIGKGEDASDGDVSDDILGRR